MMYIFLQYFTKCDNNLYLNSSLDLFFSFQKMKQPLLLVALCYDNWLYPYIVKLVNKG